MTPQESHQAAGTAATTARGEVKQEWYKKPTALHAVIGISVIIIALIINFSFEFNFFWKLLLGGALVWGGSKMAGQALKPVSVWGKIFQALGWMVVVLALMNSGVRAVGEKLVNGADEALTEFAGGESTPGVNTPAKLSKKATELEVVRLDFSPMPPGAVVEFHMLTNGLVIAKKRITQPGEVPIHICFRVKNALADQTEFVVVADSFSTDHLRLSPESVQILTANNINMVRVVAALVQTYDQNPCK